MIRETSRKSNTAVFIINFFCSNFTDDDMRDFLSNHISADTFDSMRTGNMFEDDDMEHVSVYIRRSKMDVTSFNMRFHTKEEALRCEQIVRELTK